MRKDDLFACYQEYCDINNIKTINYLNALDEAGQDAELSSLATRLYGMITNKITNIDYKLIEKSKGDVTHFDKFEQTKDCIDVLMGLAKNADDGSIEEVEVINKALLNLVDKRDLFTKGFRLNIGLIQITYNNILMAILADIGYMTTVCVEFIKNPNSTVTMEIHNIKEFKTKFALVHENLERFNALCESKDLEKAFEPMINVTAKRFVDGVTTAAVIFGVGLLGITALVTIIRSIVPICRELAFVFYDIRVKVSTYFELQQKLLEANALRIRAEKSTKDAEKVASRQLAIAKFFSKISNKFMFDYVPIKNKIEKEMKKEKEMPINQWKQDVDDQDPMTSIF